MSNQGNINNNMNVHLNTHTNAQRNDFYGQNPQMHPLRLTPPQQQRQQQQNQNVPFLIPQEQQQQQQQYHQQQQHFQSNILNQVSPIGHGGEYLGAQPGSYDPVLENSTPLLRNQASPGPQPHYVPNSANMNPNYQNPVRGQQMVPKWICPICSQNFVTEREMDLHVVGCNVQTRPPVPTSNPLSTSIPPPIEIQTLRPPNKKPDSLQLEKPLPVVIQGNYCNITISNMDSGPSSIPSTLNSPTLDTKVHVMLLWKKSIATIAREINYFDEIDGQINLKWDDANLSFQSMTQLKTGQHKGTLFIEDVDDMPAVKEFEVTQPKNKMKRLVVIHLNTQNSNSAKTPGEKEEKIFEAPKANFEKQIDNLPQAGNFDVPVGSNKNNQPIDARQNIHKMEQNSQTNLQKAYQLHQLKCIELEKELTAANNQIQTFTFERNSVNQQFEGLKKNLSDINRENTELKTSKEKLDSLVNSKDEEIVKIGGDLKNLQVERDNLQNNFNEENKKIINNEDQIKTLNSEIAQLTKQLNEYSGLDEKLDAAEKNVLQLQEKLGERNKMIQPKTDEVNDLHKKNQQLLAEKNDYEKSLNEANEKIENIQAINIELEKKLCENDTNQTAEIEQLKHNLQSKHMNHGKENEELQEKIQNLDRKLEDSSNEIKTEREEHNKTKNKFEESQQKCSELEQNQNQLLTSSMPITDVQKESELQFKLDQLQALKDSEVMAIEEQFKELKEELNQSNSDRTDLENLYKSEKDKMATDLNTAQTDLENAKNELNRISIEKIKHENELKEEIDKLAVSLNTSEKNKNNLEQQLEISSKEISDLKMNLGEKSKKVSSKITLTKSKSFEQDEILNKLKTEKGSLETVLEEKNANITQLQNEKSASEQTRQQQMKLRDEAITKLQTDNADLKGKMNNLKIEMEKSRQEFMTEKQKEIEKLNSELKASNVIITQHETKITELSQKQSSNSKELVDNALTYNNKLQEKLNELKAENTQIKVAKQMQELKITELSHKLTLYEKSGKAAVNQNEIARLNKEINSLKQKLESRSTKNEQNEKVASSLSAMNLELERERQANNTQYQLISELNEKIKNLTDKLAQNDINIETIATLKEELNKMNNENAQLKSHHEIAVGDNAEEIDLVQQEVKTLRAHNTNLTKTLQEKDIEINEQKRVIDALRIHYEHKNNQSSNSPIVNIPTRTDQLRTPQTMPKISASVPKDNQLQGILSQNTDTTLTTANTSFANKGATWNAGYTDIKQVPLCELYENPTAKAPTKTLCGDWGYQLLIKLSKHSDFTKHQEKQVFVKGKNGKLELGVLKAFVKKKEKDPFKVVGIQLYNANGNSNGEYKASKDSSRYFECKPNHGIYALIEDVFFAIQ